MSELNSHPVFARFKCKFPELGFAGIEVVVDVLWDFDKQQIVVKKEDGMAFEEYPMNEANAMPSYGVAEHYAKVWLNDPKVQSRLMSGSRQ